MSGTLRVLPAQSVMQDVSPADTASIMCVTVCSGMLLTIFYPLVTPPVVAAAAAAATLYGLNCTFVQVRAAEHHPNSSRRGGPRPLPPLRYHQAAGG